MAREIRLPDPDGPNAEFYRRSAGGTLHLQCCAACGRYRHPPRYRCASCGSADVAWRPSAGRGRLHSWVVTHHPFDRGWADEAPYTTAVVELDEGVRLVGHLDRAGISGLGIGMPLQVDLARMSDTFVFLSFRSPGGADDPG